MCDEAFLFIFVPDNSLVWCSVLIVIIILSFLLFLFGCRLRTNDIKIYCLWFEDRTLDKQIAHLYRIVIAVLLFWCSVVLWWFGIISKHCYCIIAFYPGKLNCMVAANWISSVLRIAFEWFVTLSLQSSSYHDRLLFGEIEPIEYKYRFYERNPWVDAINSLVFSIRLKY